MKYIHLALMVTVVGLFLMLAADDLAVNGILLDSRESVMKVAFIGLFIFIIMTFYRGFLNAKKANKN